MYTNMGANTSWLKSGPKQGRVQQASPIPVTSRTKPVASINKQNFNLISKDSDCSGHNSQFLNTCFHFSFYAIIRPFQHHKHKQPADPVAPHILNTASKKRSNKDTQHCLPQKLRSQSQCFCVTNYIKHNTSEGCN